jgi:ubiquinone/menaquinone biosynthesis C-methylase UbiE
MMKDSYRFISGFYDRVFDSMNKGLRLIGLLMFHPKKGMYVLDVGCGTGSHLELYQRFKCHLYGVDLSPAMLEVARNRLGDAAQLDLGNATDLPYEDGKFDLVITMLSLHEMAPGTRTLVMKEIKRVLKDKGRILLIDFQPGPVQSFKGWLSKIMILISELAAGWTHFRNYRNFMANGGLHKLVQQHGITIEKQQILAGGTFANLLLQKSTGK